MNADIPETNALPKTKKTKPNIILVQKTAN
jgi:hypothetical protein